MSDVVLFFVTLAFVMASFVGIVIAQMKFLQFRRRDELPEYELSPEAIRKGKTPPSDRTRWVGVYLAYTVIPVLGFAYFWFTHVVVRPQSPGGAITMLAVGAVIAVVGLILIRYGDYDEVEDVPSDSWHTTE